MQQSTANMSTFQKKKMLDFFQDPERVEKYISRGMAEEFWSFGIEDFVVLLQRLMNTVWKRSDQKPWGTFSYEEPNSISPLNGDEQGEGVFPWITFDTISRTPSKSHKGLKPRQFETVQDENNPEDYFRVYRQWYDCEVEFAVFAPTNREAMDTQMKLESLVHQYTGLLKEMGVSDIIFKEEVGSKNRTASKWNSDIPHRTVTYYVRIERIIAVRNSYLKAIETKVRADMLDGQEGEGSHDIVLEYKSTEQGSYENNDSEFMNLYDNFVK